MTEDLEVTYSTRQSEVKPVPNTQVQQERWWLSRYTAIYFFLGTSCPLLGSEQSHKPELSFLLCLQL